MIPGHTPHCDLANCFCNPSDRHTAGGVFKRLEEQAAAAKTTQEYLWSLLRPMVEQLIVETLVQMETQKNGNSQRTGATDPIEVDPEAERDAAAAAIAGAQAVIDQAGNRRARQA